MATYFLSPRGNDGALGTLDAPWRTFAHAFAKLQPGDELLLRAGVYLLQRRPELPSGSPGKPVTLASVPGEVPILDGAALVAANFHRRPEPYHKEQGLIDLESAHDVVIRGLHLRHSYSAGINVFDSQRIDIINNTIELTFHSASAVWDTTRTGVCRDIRVLGNTVTKATTWDMKPLEGYDEELHEPPHEAISIAGAHRFEVAWNHVHHCDKEGIDVKETSQHGRVHHNYVHDIARQGLYMDTWFGVLANIEFDHNVVHDCGSAGIAVSVEDRDLMHSIDIHHNLVFDNAGSGLFFSIWGGDHLRKAIRVRNNTFHHNGWGKPEPGRDFFYITGGIYFLSAALEDVQLTDNLVTDNRGFAIGYSEEFLKGGATVEQAFERRQITLEGNKALDRCNLGLHYPLSLGYPGSFHNVRPWVGGGIDSGGVPSYVDVRGQDFSLRSSPDSNDTLHVGVYAPGERCDFWWRADFPPAMTGTKKGGQLNA